MKKKIKNDNKLSLMQKILQQICKAVLLAPYRFPNIFAQSFSDSLKRWTFFILCFEITGLCVVLQASITLLTLST